MIILVNHKTSLNYNQYEIASINKALTDLSFNNLRWYFGI